jgi:acyl-ACP thioesterase
MDEFGRLRLDAVARFLQDVAIEDVSETGWGTPEHLWFIRRIRIEVREPFLRDSEVELVTWCSGLAAIAAGRRWSVAGDAGGRLEVDSVWIHLGPDQRPARIEDFGVYAEATAGRSVSTRLELPAPVNGTARGWPLRSSDVDLHGHVNNAVYWEAVEDALRETAVDASAPLAAELDYHNPVDLADLVDLVVEDNRGEALSVGFRVGETVRAVARVEAGRPPASR